MTQRAGKYVFRRVGWNPFMLPSGRRRLEELSRYYEQVFEEIARRADEQAATSADQEIVITSSVIEQTVSALQSNPPYLETVTKEEDSDSTFDSHVSTPSARVYRLKNFKSARRLTAPVTPDEDDASLSGASQISDQSDRPEAN